MLSSADLDTIRASVATLQTSYDSDPVAFRGPDLRSDSRALYWEGDDLMTAKRIRDRLAANQSDVDAALIKQVENMIRAH